MSGLRFCTLSHLIEHPPDEVPSLWGDGMMPSRSLVMLHGTSKLGKSFWTLNFALLGAMGAQEFLGLDLPKDPFTSVILQNEIHIRGMYERTAGMLTKMSEYVGYAPTEGEQNRILINMERGRRLADDRVFSEFTDMIRFFKPALVVLDPLAHVLTQNENDNALVGAMLEKIRIWCDDPGCTVLVIHHNSKSGEGNWGRTPQQHARGADRLNADPDCILSMIPMARQPCGPAAKLHFASRYGRGMEPFSIRFNEETLFFERFLDENSDVQMFATWIEAAGGWLSHDALIEKMHEEWNIWDPKGGHRTAKRRIKEALATGVMVSEMVGGEAGYAVPSAPPEAS